MLTKCDRIACAVAALIALGALIFGIYLPNTTDPLILLIIVAVAAAFIIWFKSCKPGLCHIIMVGVTGFTLGAGLLAVALLIGTTAPMLTQVLIIVAILAAVLLVIGTFMGCTTCQGCVKQKDPPGLIKR